MTSQLASQAVKALAWKTVQQGSTKLIVLVRMLVLARLLAPEDFGYLAIAMVTIQTLAGVTDFGMLPALIQRRHLEAAHYHTAWTIGLVRGAAISTVVMAAAPLIAGLFSQPGATAVIRVLALRPLIEATTSIRIADLNRDLKFRHLALINVSSVLVEAVVSITLASRFGVWALVAGALAAPLWTAIASFIAAPYRPSLSVDRSVAQSLIHFGRWIFLAGLMSVAGGASLQVIISRSLGPAELGLYFLAAKLAFLPSELASDMVGAVAFPVYAKLQSNLEQAARAFKTVVVGMSAVLIPLSLLLLTLAPSFVEDVLGARWIGTAPVVRVLALVAIIGLFGDAVVPLLKGLGQPGKVVALEGAQAGVLVVSAFLLTSRFGLIGATLAWVPAAVVASPLLGVLFASQVLRSSLWDIFKALGAITGASMVGCLLAWGVEALIPGIQGLLIAILLSVPGIVTLLLVLDSRWEFGLTLEFTRLFPQLADLRQKIAFGSGSTSGGPR